MRRPAPCRAGSAGPWIDALGVAIFLCLMLLSPFGLAALNWDYVTPQSAVFMRLHPSTYLITLAFILVLLRRGNPIDEGLRILRADAGIGLYLAPWALLAYAVTVQKQVIGIVIDTFLMPLLVIVICDRLSPTVRLPMAYLGHTVFMVNAALGLIEFLTGSHLTPMVIPGLTEDADYRSKAFFGHPLVNALMMGCYGVMLLCGGGRILPAWLRNAAFLITHIAMVPFGGRTALVLLLTADAAALGLVLLRLISGGKVRIGYLAATTLALPLLPLAAGGLVQTGFLDKLLERFVADGGSARTRIVMFEMAQKLTWDDLLFGPPQDYVKFMMNVFGIEFGIESTWVAFVYYFGFLVSILFWIGLVILVLLLMKRCDPKAWCVVVFFFLVNSSFLGLAGRTYQLSFFCMAMLIMMPRRFPRLLAPPCAALRPAPSLRGRKAC